jgi:hypothetical protein
MRFSQAIISLVRAVLSLRFLARSVFALLMLIYLSVVMASHSVPLSPALEIPLAVAGWLAVPFVMALHYWQGRRYGESDARSLQPDWRVIQHLAFAAAAALALYFAFTGNLSLACPQHATSCLKIDNWKMADGHYYRHFPYDSEGNDYPGASWVEISRPVYVAEVGTRLREAAKFGICVLSLAWLLTLGLRRPDDGQ